MKRTFQFFIVIVCFAASGCATYENQFSYLNAQSFSQEKVFLRRTRFISSSFGIITNLQNSRIPLTEKQRKTIQSFLLTATHVGSSRLQANMKVCYWLENCHDSCGAPIAFTRKGEIINAQLPEKEKNALAEFILDIAQQFEIHSSHSEMLRSHVR